MCNFILQHEELLCGQLQDKHRYNVVRGERSRWTPASHKTAGSYRSVSHHSTQQNESFEWPIKSLIQPPIQRPLLLKLLTIQGLSHTHTHTALAPSKEHSKHITKIQEKIKEGSFLSHKTRWKFNTKLQIHIKLCCIFLQKFFEQPVMKPSLDFIERKVRLQAALTETHRDSDEMSGWQQKSLFYLINRQIYAARHQNPNQMYSMCSMWHVYCSELSCIVPDGFFF